MQFNIPALGSALDVALHQRIDNKTKPLGSLGRIEALALQIGRIQQTLTPQFDQPHLIVFAGDHGARVEVRGQLSADRRQIEATRIKFE